MSTSNRGGGTPNGGADRASTTARFTRLWTIPETAEFVGCSERSLYALRESGALVPVLSTPGKVRYFPGDVLAYAGLTMEQALTLAAALDAVNAGYEEVA